MPTLGEVRTHVNARLADLWINEVRPRQDAYLAARGRYWQGIRTTDLADLPDNMTLDLDVKTSTPATARRPTDQAEDWDDVGIALGATLPCALVIDTYDGPRGKGYVATVLVRFEGAVYMRAQEYHEPGSEGEPERQHGWIRGGRG